MKNSITGKRIWITGAGSGIGKSITLALAKAGNQLVISGRNQDKLNEVVLSYPNNISALACDVSDDLAQDKVRAELKALLGTVDIAIFSAGHCEYIEHANMDTALFRRVYDVNVFGTVNSIAIVMPLLATSTKSAGANRGLLVGIASLSAVLGLPRAEAYGSSKAAMNYLFDSLRLDLANRGVDVTVVNPGFVKTPMIQANDFPMPFLMDADAAASRIIIGMEKRQRTIQFPKRLYFLLKLAACLPFLWNKLAVFALARERRSQAKS